MHKTTIRGLPFTLMLLLLAGVGFAQSPNYSGTYILTGASGDLRFDPKMKDQPIFRVVQTTDELQTMLTEKEGTESVVLPLSGNEAEFATVSGKPGKARIETKNGQMHINKTIQLRNDPNLSPSAIYEVEKWNLSKDGKLLKICGDSEVRGGIVQFKKSGCQIFRRQ
jgi:hypothetical protein